MKYRLAELSAKQLIGSVRTSPQYLQYPTIFQKNLIPNDAFELLNQLWGKEFTRGRTIEFYLLKNVFVVSSGIVFTSSGELIPGTQADVPESGIKKAFEDIEKIFQSDHSIPTLARGILCEKEGWQNYGHWLIEMLPKAFLIKRELGINDWPIITRSRPGKMADVIQESLSVIGINKDLIFNTDGAPIHFDELIVVNGMTSHSSYISSPVMECMDEIASKANPGFAQHIYVPRRPSKSRDFEHEPDIKNLLIGEGYTETVTADLSFLKQVGAFKGATSVIGAMGAALTNIVFCRPGTEIITFAPASARELFFWLLASGKNLKYYEVRCELVGEKKGWLPWDRSQRISLPAMQNIISHVRNMSHLSAFVSDQITPNHLTTKEWVWCFSHAKNKVFNVTFSVDGRVIGYSHYNEKSWKINHSVLEILDFHGRTTWRFDDIHVVNGKTSLRARYCLASHVHSILYMEEADE